MKKPEMERNIGRGAPGARKQGGKKQIRKQFSKKTLKTIFDQISFVVKHKAVGGQGEKLASCLFQIPDLVAACK